MKTCKEVERGLVEFAALPPAEIPDAVRRHLTGCPACERRLAVARLARGLVAVGVEEMAPPERFSEQVMAAIVALRSPREAEPDVWRPAWGLVPAFAAAVAAMFILYQTDEGQLPTGLFSTEGLSAGEHLVLGASAPEADTVLDAVLEGNGE